MAKLKNGKNCSVNTAHSTKIWSSLNCWPKQNKNNNILCSCTYVQESPSTHLRWTLQLPGAHKAVRALWWRRPKEFTVLSALGRLFLSEFLRYNKSYGLSSLFLALVEPGVYFGQFEARDESSERMRSAYLSTAAPSLSKRSTTRSCPSAHAKCKAVFPWLFLTLMERMLRPESNASTISSQPYLKKETIWCSLKISS